MIKSMKIDNFKSLNSFELHLTPFTVLIGDNSVGKTSVLQAIGFLKCCCTSSFDKFLEDHKLSVSDIDSKLNNKRNITFTTTLSLEGKEIVWQIVVAQSKDQLVLNRESVYLCSSSSAETSSDAGGQDGMKFLSYTGGKNSFLLNAKTNEKDPTMHGVISNSIIKFVDLDKQADSYPELTAIKRFFSNMETLDLLSPYNMKGSSKGLSDTIGLNGEKLGAFIKKLPQSQKEALVADVRRFVPKVAALIPKTKQYGWIHLETEEEIDNKRIRMSSVNISDGLLRIIAICSTRFLNNSGGAILFDELEDGVNNEHLEQLVSLLKEIQHNRGVQIIATTHNTLLLDYVLDDSSRSLDGDSDTSPTESLIFMYGDESGKTMARNILDSGDIREQLSYMFPGEIVLNTTNSELRRLLEKEDRDEDFSCR